MYIPPIVSTIGDLIGCKVVAKRRFDPSPDFKGVWLTSSPDRFYGWGYFKIICMKHIKSIKEIKAFFREIVVPFTPEDNFHSYEIGGRKVFSTTEAQELNRLMAEAWHTCNLLGVDIHDLHSVGKKYN